MKVTQAMFQAFATVQVPERATADQAIWAGIQAVLDLIEDQDRTRIAGAVNRLAEIDANDPEQAHADADRVLLDFVPDLVSRAWSDTESRSGGFWYA